MGKLLVPNHDPARLRRVLDDRQRLIGVRETCRPNQNWTCRMIFGTCRRRPTAAASCSRYLRIKLPSLQVDREALDRQVQERREALQREREAERRVVGQAGAGALSERRREATDRSPNSLPGCTQGARRQQLPHRPDAVHAAGRRGAAAPRRRGGRGPGTEAAAGRSAGPGAPGVEGGQGTALECSLMRERKYIHSSGAPQLPPPSGEPPGRRGAGGRG